MPSLQGQVRRSQLSLMNYLSALLRHGDARTLVCRSQTTHSPELSNLGNLVCFASCSGQSTVSATAGDHPDVDSIEAELSECSPSSPLMEQALTSTPSFLRQLYFKMVLSVLINSCFHPLCVSFSVRALLTIFFVKGD